MSVQPDSSRLLKSFLDIGVQLSQEPDARSVLQTIVTSAMELTGARYGAALTIRPDGTIREFVYRGMTEEQVARLPHIPEGKGLLGEVLTMREPLRVDHIAEHPASVGFPDRHVSMAAFLGVPLLARGDLIGSLYLTKSPGEPSFTQSDEDLIEAMGALAAVGIQNSRLLAVESERAHRADVLREIFRRVGGSLNAEQVLATTVEQLGKAANADRCFIRLIREPGTIALGTIAYEWTVPGVDRVSDDPGRQYPVSSLAVTTGRTQGSSDVTRDERLLEANIPGTTDDYLAHDTYAALASPLLWSDEVTGVLTLNSLKPRTWTASDEEMIEAVAHSASVALHNAQMYEQAVQSAEALRALDDMRSDFVSMVSHEVRSPMTVIAGIADILERRSDALPDHERVRLIQSLGREARRLTKLVSQVLDLEALERRGITLELVPVDLVELADETVTDAGLGERVSVQTKAGDPTVSADRDRVKQVLLNLLTNAAKFSPENSPIIVAIEPEKDVIAVSVVDQGVGIEPTDFSRLFQPFSRLGGVSTKGGSGIGLYLCKMIVDHHDGTIDVESSAGRGSTFTFRLPR